MVEVGVMRFGFGFVCGRVFGEKLWRSSMAPADEAEAVLNRWQCAKCVADYLLV